MAVIALAIAIVVNVNSLALFNMDFGSLPQPTGMLIYIMYLQMSAKFYHILTTATTAVQIWGESPLTTVVVLHVALYSGPQPLFV